MYQISVYLFPLPLSDSGNLQLGAVEIELLQHARLIFAEKVKTARQFIASRKLGIDIDQLILIEIDQTNGAGFQKEATQLLMQHKTALVMSECGCPGVADPGQQIVALAHKLGAKVLPLVGPNSILLALMGSGLNGQQFHFQGYLPIDKAERIKCIKKLEQEVQKQGVTQIFIETPHRNKALFCALVENLKPDIKLCFAKDLTGKNEWIATKTVGEWRKQMPEWEKLPAIFLIGR
jgi:16S rRNA (cytidine1402-2'-O)-methyltransferase